MACEERKCTI